VQIPPAAVDGQLPGSIRRECLWRGMEHHRARRQGYKDRSAPHATARGVGPQRRAVEERWNRRRTAAISLRAAIVGGPIVASVAAMAILSRVIPSPSGHAGMEIRVAWWAAILAGSLAAMWLVDRAARRLAPLAALLDMAVLFPGRAPTRLKVARTAGDLRQLQELTENPDKVNARNGLAEAAEQILALVGSLRAHDRHTRGHSERVRVYTDLIAAELRLPTAAVDRLRWAALLHDIGKLRVPAATLNKPSKLSEPEWASIRKHPLAGAELAAPLLPWLGEWGKAIAEHHERFDGTGYPLGLSGRDISLAGRIVAVADSFEVMTGPRTYKKAMTRAAALEETVRFSGTQFDPDIVRALLAVSAPRLRWAMGPTSWLVGTPLLGSAPSLTAAGVASQAAISVSVVAVAGVTGLTSPTVATATSPAPAVAQAITSPSTTASSVPDHAAGNDPVPQAAGAYVAPPAARPSATSKTITASATATATKTVATASPAASIPTLSVAPTPQPSPSNAPKFKPSSRPPGQGKKTDGSSGKSKQKGK
jgi:putative nucleotidyltransferase with HDIG domain